MMEAKKNLRTWLVAKNNNPVVGEITNPENWMWEQRGNKFYPVEEIESKKVKSDPEYDRMFAELDPDATNEELEAQGWTVVGEMSYGDDAVVDYREGCGHLVMN